jgi:predicted AAA+ superfamily ATPase
VEGDRGKRLENLVALHLLKHLHFIEDTQGLDTRLHYLRDRQGREVDFLWMDDMDAIRKKSAKPRLLEVNAGDEPPARGLRYFAQRLGFEAMQVSLDARREEQFADVSVQPVTRFLSSLSC